MGLRSGLLWSPVNIDESQPGGFAESPYQYESSYYSWGNVDGHKPTSPSSFSPWDWGGVNSEVPYYEGQVYGTTPGSLLTGDVPLTHDIANRLFGTGWRMPTADDFAELLENCDFIDANGVIVESADKRVAINGIVGIRLKSRVNGATIFFAAAGLGVNTTWFYQGSDGYYWSSSYDSPRNAKVLVLNTSGVYANNTSVRSDGFPVRPVFNPFAV